MKKLLFVLLLLAAAPVFAQGNRTERDIRAVLAAQQGAWNRGDLDGYMAAGYWHSDSLLFIGKSGPTYGYDSTLARYKKGYPNRSAMGQLRFDIVRIDALSARAAFVAGRWHLTRAAGDVGGAFTLLWKKERGRWVIVADHSS